MKKYTQGNDYYEVIYRMRSNSRPKKHSTEKENSKKHKASKEKEMLKKEVEALRIQ